MLDAHHSLAHQHRLLLVTQGLEKWGTVTGVGARPTPTCLTLLSEPHRSLALVPSGCTFYAYFAQRQQRKGHNSAAVTMKSTPHSRDDFTFKKSVFNPLFS